MNMAYAGDESGIIYVTTSRGFIVVYRAPVVAGRLEEPQPTHAKNVERMLHAYVVRDLTDAIESNERGEEWLPAKAAEIYSLVLEHDTWEVAPLPPNCNFNKVGSQEKVEAHPETEGPLHPPWPLSGRGCRLCQNLCPRCEASDPSYLYVDCGYAIAGDMPVGFEDCRS